LIGVIFFDLANSLNTTGCCFAGESQEIAAPLVVG